MAVYCPDCGKKLPDQAEFCDNCGTKIPAHDTSRGSSPAKKKLNILWLIVKWFFILNVAGGVLLLLLSGLESVYHRTAEADPPVQRAPGNDPGPVSGKAAAVAGALAPGMQDIPQGLSDLSDVWFDDFLFYEDDVYDNGIPAGAVMREAGYIGGEWKYCMTFNRTIAGEERIDEIGTAEVAFSQYGAQLILHPQYIRFGSDVIPESEEEVGYEPFSGTWDPEYIDLSDGRIAIGLGPYYSFEGRDYVLGNVVVRESGMFGDVLLVRP